MRRWGVNGVCPACGRARGWRGRHPELRPGCRALPRSVRGRQWRWMRPAGGAVRSGRGRPTAARPSEVVPGPRVRLRARGIVPQAQGGVMATGQTLLAVDRLTKQYGDVVALNDVSFTITDGITGILGENGAGKSTAIKILLGLLQATSGSATVLGENASRNVAARARVGYMPEHDCLPSQVSAAEFLTHMAEVSGLPPSMARTRAADTLRHVGLFEERYRAIGGYSTGMKQRV